MYNWSVDATKFEKYHPLEYRNWQLVQMINYGLSGEKMDAQELKQAWPKIKDQLDPYKRRALEYLIWGKLYSLPTNMTFWNSFPKN
jgi:hypothetical protein